MVDFFETALRRGDDTLNTEDLALSAGSPGLSKTLDNLDIAARPAPPCSRFSATASPLVSPPDDLALTPATACLRWVRVSSSGAWTG